MKQTAKRMMSAMMAACLRPTRSARENFRRLCAHAFLAAEIGSPLPASVVVLDKLSVHGTRRIRFGKNVLLYPGLHLETQGDAWIDIGDDVVISRGTHIVAMAGVTIGRGSMIGEYVSIRDANHLREESCSIRNSGHSAKPIVLGEEVWVGRGAAVLAGVRIGNKATIAANAAVTHDVDAGTTVAGVPATPLPRHPKGNTP
jgi:acetyltransferase-like isoleucine patch superfamily enzyme